MFSVMVTAFLTLWKGPNLPGDLRSAIPYGPISLSARMVGKLDALRPCSAAVCLTSGICSWKVVPGASEFGPPKNAPWLSSFTSIMALYLDPMGANKVLGAPPGRPLLLAPVFRQLAAASAKGLWTLHLELCTVRGLSNDQHVPYS